MSFKSTFGSTSVSVEDALFRGYARDGGMILPTSLPFFSRPELERLSTLPYGALLEHILCAIIDDSELPHDEIRKAVAQVEQATSGVTTVHLKNSFHVLELFSGPTLAFKDYGLQLLAALIDLRGKNRRSLVVATSGDTGSAALEAFSNCSRSTISVLFPEGRISPLQARQMTRVSAPNTRVFRVKNSTSDTLDRVLLRIFQDPRSDDLNVGSVNSINVFRILAQMAHFFKGYFDVIRQRGTHSQLGKERVRMIIPSGALGNTAAAVLCVKMGLPIDIVCANSSPNDITATFVQSGVYRAKPVSPTIAPAIDICGPYNIERILYFATNQDPKETFRLMQEWKSGSLSLSQPLLLRLQSLISAFSADEDDIKKAIINVHATHNYLLCPHTATAVAVCESLRLSNDELSLTCILATASPLKFLDLVLKVLPEGTQIESHPSLSEERLQKEQDHSILADQEGAGEDLLVESVWENLREMNEMDSVK